MVTCGENLKSDVVICRRKMEKIRSFRAKSQRTKSDGGRRRMDHISGFIAGTNQQQGITLPKEV